MEDSVYLESPRALWVAALTIVVSVIVVLAVREAAVRILHPDPAFAPLTLAPPIVDTFICTVVAIFVFLGIASYPNPVRRWRRVATAVLIVSFVPDMLLASSHSMGGAWPEACALMIMHVVVWATCVTLLPGLAFTKHPPPRRASDRRLSILSDTH